MTWWEVEALAQFGTPVRRASWATTKSVVFARGGGTERAVLVVRDGSAEAVASATTFGAVEFGAEDWLPAA